jgi:hypothetical protein
MAKEPDSSLYPVEDLDVEVWHVIVNENGKRMDSILCSVNIVEIENKEPGYFYYPKQRAYCFEKIFEKTSTPIGYEYHLNEIIKIEVENIKTGKITYAETSLVNSFYVKSPQPGTPLNLKPNQSSSNFKWNHAKNGRIYDVYYTMEYKEGPANKPIKEWDKKSIVWHVGSHSSTRTGNGNLQEETFHFNPSAFYGKILRDIPYNTNILRSPYRDVKLSIWCGDEDLYYYHNINDPAGGGLSQERPEYTNLKTKIFSEELGGYQELEKESFGLFSSRIVKHIPILLHPEMVGKYLPEIDRQFKGEILED